MLRSVTIIILGKLMLGIYPILAHKYGFEGMCAAALLLATVLSFVSISVVLWVLGPVPGWSA